MKFQYGKQDWKTFERGEENCCLMTNSLGGFSSLSLIGSCSRNDQAVLMACLKSPNHRYNMIHRLEERLFCGEEGFFLSSQDYTRKERREDGFLRQEGFFFEDYPVWTYRVCGVEVVRTIVLAQGENTVGIRYEIRNGSGERVSLTVMPHLEFVPKGSRMPADKKFAIEPYGFADGGGARISSDGIALYLRTNGELETIPLQICEGLYYAEDEKDGRQSVGRTAVNHRITMEIPCGREAVLELVYGTSPVGKHVSEIVEQVSRYRRDLVKKSGFVAEPAMTLALAADQFLSYRESTDGWTILAGYPFFEDWGRDTMIALTGCCLVTRRYEAAKSILRTFAAYCRRGLLPNLFPEGSEEPGYNTVDAALLFIIAVWEYFCRTKDSALVAELFPVMADIVRWYAEGTDYGIHMDTDGLLAAGSGYDQVTWMDVRIGDILPTPRHGKPVEINAYWYNVLRIMEKFCSMEKTGSTEEAVCSMEKTGSTEKAVCSMEKSDSGATGHEGDKGNRENGKHKECGENRNYGLMADRVKACFEERFWNEKTGCLKDVICGGPAEEQIRCNQIWVVSLPFSLLSPEKERRVVETVYAKLYTPLGLRTLDPEDAQYHGFYGGPQKERDLAYHQGTVWTFPLGGFYLAYLKVNGYSGEAKERVRRMLELMEPSLREGCIGQLAEIFDGDNPSVSKGCFAQAWSVGEILRVYDRLREENV